MKQTTYTILSNAPLAKDVFKMELEGDNGAFTNPGQFVNLKLEGLYLRRPISVCDIEGDKLTLIYKVVGRGTDKMRSMRQGMAIDALTGLGNGYDTSLAGDRPLLIGGGVGVPPLYLLARRLIADGKSVKVRLGFNTNEDVFYFDEFLKLGAEVRLATADGSRGEKGFVTDILPDCSHYFACGPEPMLKAVHRAVQADGQLSFESRMGCGFGACMGCTCQTITGYKRICKDGPVLRKGEILWKD